MKLSVVIPAHNEENYLPETLESLRAALAVMPDAEVIVVDNESTDSTREIACSFAARVVEESVRNIGAVRNAGASAALGDLLFFLDADTIVGHGVLESFLRAMENPSCLGGSFAAEYLPGVNRRWIRWYLQLCAVIGKVVKMRQGAAQFCRKQVFEELGGYDETIYVGEDVEFQWRLDRLAKKRGGYTAFIESSKVSTSSRRFDKTGLFRIIVITHPLTVFFGWRIRSLWKDWYEHAVR